MEVIDLSIWDQRWEALQINSPATKISIDYSGRFLATHLANLDIEFWDIKEYPQRQLTLKCTPSDLLSGYACKFVAWSYRSSNVAVLYNNNCNGNSSLKLIDLSRIRDRSRIIRIPINATYVSFLPKSINEMFVSFNDCSNFLLITSQKNKTRIRSYAFHNLSPITFPNQKAVLELEEDDVSFLGHQLFQQKTHIPIECPFQPYFVCSSTSICKYSFHRNSDLKVQCLTSKSYKEDHNVNNHTTTSSISILAYNISIEYDLLILLLSNNSVEVLDASTLNSIRIFSYPSISSPVLPVMSDGCISSTSPSIGFITLKLDSTLGRQLISSDQKFNCMSLQVSTENEFNKGVDYHIRNTIATAIINSPISSSYDISQMLSTPPPSLPPSLLTFAVFHGQSCLDIISGCLLPPPPPAHTPLPMSHTMSFPANTTILTLLSSPQSAVLTALSTNGMVWFSRKQQPPEPPQLTSTVDSPPTPAPPRGTFLLVDKLLVHNEREDELDRAVRTHRHRRIKSPPTATGYSTTVTGTAIAAELGSNLISEGNQSFSEEGTTNNNGITVGIKHDEYETCIGNINNDNSNNQKQQSPPEDLKQLCLSNEWNCVPSMLLQSQVPPQLLQEEKEEDEKWLQELPTDNTEEGDYNTASVSASVYGYGYAARPAAVLKLSQPPMACPWTLSELLAYRYSLGNPMKGTGGAAAEPEQAAAAADSTTPASNQESTLERKMEADKALPPAKPFPSVSNNKKARTKSSTTTTPTMPTIRTTASATANTTSTTPSGCQIMTRHSERKACAKEKSSQDDDDDDASNHKKRRQRRSLQHSDRNNSKNSSNNSRNIDDNDRHIDANDRNIDDDKAPGLVAVNRSKRAREEFPFSDIYFPRKYKSPSSQEIKAIVYVKKEQKQKQEEYDEDTEQLLQQDQQEQSEHKNKEWKTRCIVRQCLNGMVDTLPPAPPLSPSDPRTSTSTSIPVVPAARPKFASRRGRPRRPLQPAGNASGSGAGCGDVTVPPSRKKRAHVQHSDASPVVTTAAPPPTEGSPPWAIDGLPGGSGTDSMCYRTTSTSPLDLMSFCTIATVTSSEVDVDAADGRRLPVSVQWESYEEEISGHRHSNSDIHTVFHGIHYTNYRNISISSNNNNRDISDINYNSINNSYHPTSTSHVGLLQSHGEILTNATSSSSSTTFDGSESEEQKETVVTMDTRGASIKSDDNSNNNLNGASGTGNQFLQWESIELNAAAQTATKTNTISTTANSENISPSDVTPASQYSLFNKRYDVNHRHITSSTNITATGHPPSTGNSSNSSNSNIHNSSYSNNSKTQNISSSSNNSNSNNNINNSSSSYKSNINDYNNNNLNSSYSNSNSYNKSSYSSNYHNSSYSNSNNNSSYNNNNLNSSYSNSNSYNNSSYSNNNSSYSSNRVSPSQRPPLIPRASSRSSATPSTRTTSTTSTICPATPMYAPSLHSTSTPPSSSFTPTATPTPPTSTAAEPSTYPLLSPPLSLASIHRNFSGTFSGVFAQCSVAPINALADPASLTTPFHPTPTPKDMLATRPYLCTPPDPCHDPLRLATSLPAMTYLSLEDLGIVEEAALEVTVSPEAGLITDLTQYDDADDDDGSLSKIEHCPRGARDDSSTVGTDVSHVDTTVAVVAKQPLPISRSSCSCSSSSQYSHDPSVGLHILLPESTALVPILGSRIMDDNKSNLSGCSSHSLASTPTTPSSTGMDASAGRKAYKLRIAHLTDTEKSPKL